MLNEKTFNTQAHIVTDKNVIEQVTRHDRTPVLHRICISQHNCAFPHNFSVHILITPIVIHIRTFIFFVNCIELTLRNHTLTTHDLTSASIRASYGEYYKAAITMVFCPWSYCVRRLYIFVNRQMQYLAISRTVSAICHKLRAFAVLIYKWGNREII